MHGLFFFSFKQLNRAFNLKTKDMESILYTLHYTKTIGGGDTGEPEQTTKHSRYELTKKELHSLIYSLKYGDFGCSFGNFEIEEQ
jgi:hypothetical protein